jgi:hypothetical protein
VTETINHLAESVVINPTIGTSDTAHMEEISIPTT